MPMKRFPLAPCILAAGCMIATGFLKTPPASAQQAITPASVCGTWQSVPRSGGFIQASSNNSIRKGAGGGSGTVTYTIQESVGREFKASQSINMKPGISFFMGGTYTSNAARKLIGVSQGDTIYFAMENEQGIEKWLRLPDNSFDVIGVESGSHARAYHYRINQTASLPCK